MELNVGEFDHVNALSKFLVSPRHLAMANGKTTIKTTRKETSKDKGYAMIAKEVMHKGLKTIEANETLVSAAHQMKDLDIGVLPVVSGNKVVGVLTDRDIVTRCLAEDKDYKSSRASDCMTKNVVCVNEDSDLEEVSRRMVDGKVSRVFIENNQHRPVGLISVEDLVHHSDPDLFTKTMSAIKS